MVHLRHVSQQCLMGDVSITALDHVSVDLEKGELVVALGPSGSGKNTLLDIIGALDSPTEGALPTRGGWRPSPNRKMGSDGAARAGKAAINELLW